MHKATLMTLAFLVLGSRGGEPTATATASSGGQDPVRRWLASLVLRLPPISVEVDIVGNVTLPDLTCRHLQLGAIASTERMAAEVFELNVSGIGIGCAGNVTIKGKHTKEQRGTVALAVSGSNFSLGVRLVNNKTDGLASALAVEFNLMALNISDMEIHGLAGSGIINLLIGLLKPKVEQTMETEVITLVDKLITQNLTALLQKVDASILPFIHPPPPPPPPVVPPGMLDLQHSQLVADIDFLLNDLIGATGNHSINHLIDAVTGGTGGFHFNDHNRVNFTLALPGLANITLGLSSMAVEGLDTWSTFRFLVPTDNYTLQSDTQLDVFRLNVSFFIMVNASGGDVSAEGLYEEGTLVLDLSAAQLRIVMQAAVLPDSHIEGDEWKELPCILQKFHSTLHASPVAVPSSVVPHSLHISHQAHSVQLPNIHAQSD